MMLEGYSHRTNVSTLPTQASLAIASSRLHAYWERCRCRALLYSQQLKEVICNGGCHEQCNGWLWLGVLSYHTWAAGGQVRRCGTYAQL